MNLQNIKGKTAVVTGTGGIGFAAAKALAGAGADVILAGRNPESGEKAVSDILGYFPGATIRFELLDLAELDSVAALCEKLNSKLEKIDILMCVAGLMMPDELKKTKEGVEMQFAVNYLGHYALACGLFGLLRKSEDPRIITFSSIADMPERFDLGDATASLWYSASISYALSKLCCLMFAVELAKRSEENGWGISAFCVHPGLARTQLFNRSHGFTMTILRIIFFIFPFIRQSAEHAALPALYCASSKRAVSGKYYGPWFFAFGPPRRTGMPARAKNRKLRKELWDLSVSLTGLDIS